MLSKVIKYTDLSKYTWFPMLLIPTQISLIELFHYWWKGFPSDTSTVVVLNPQQHWQYWNLKSAFSFLHASLLSLQVKKWKLFWAYHGRKAHLIKIFLTVFHFIESKLYVSVHNIIYYLVPQCRYKQALWMTQGKETEISPIQTCGGGNT
jgi:hypothetical protein